MNKTEGFIAGGLLTLSSANEVVSGHSAVKFPHRLIRGEANRDLRV